MDNLHPGQMLGPYRVIGQIGQGGMATVYKAYQPSMDRHVAIKVLPSQLAETQEFVTRFQQEARTIARLEHPHILPVFDYGETDGLTYFVMRYLEAGTLKERMANGRPLPLPEVDRIFTQLTEALSYAHGRGVVHRDLKPANALVDEHGNLFLTDFGIAKILESASPRLTQTDAIMGTPAYISPEQAQAKAVDQRSDIYSLGIILYEMVTGQVPFAADTPLAIILKHVSDPLPPPSRVKADISPAIEKVILKALAKDPQDRFETAAEFLSAWKRALAEAENETAKPETSPQLQTVAVQSNPKPTIAETPQPKSGRSVGWIAGCLVALCLLAVVGGGGLYALSNAGFFSGLGSPTSTSVPTESAVIVEVPNPTQAIATNADSATAIPTLATRALINDDFAVENWGTATETNYAIEYLNEALNMQVFRENWIVWSTPDDVDYEGVHAEVTAKLNKTDPNTAFGILCDQQSSADESRYNFAITRSGQYVIEKAVAGKDSIYLTNNNDWGTSSLIEKDKSSYRVGADCAGGQLTLYVDGKKIASVTDDAYTNGGVGLFTWSAIGEVTANVSFDDFVLTALP